MLRKNTPFVWDEKCRKAVQQLSADLQQAVLRVSPTGSKFRLETDASDVAVGAVLYDFDEFEKNTSPLPIMFMSKTLNQTEQNWSTAEREAYAIVWALEAADPFLRGRQVQVMCDHKNLQWMMSKKSGKIARWCSRLTEYDVEIIYQKGDKNIVADFLSRYIEDDPFVKDTMYCYGLTAVAKQPTKKRRRNRDDPSEDPKDIIDRYSSTSSGGANRAYMHEEIEVPVEVERALKLPFLIEDIVEPEIGEVIAAQEAELPKPLYKGMYKADDTWFYLNGLWVPPSLRN